MPNDAPDPFDAPGSLQRTWSSVVDREDYRDDIARDLDRVARFAWAGAWEDLLALAKQPDPQHNIELVNTPRFGTRSGYASLHHAAWHGADRAVVEQLLGLGAWRTLRTLNGLLPRDIARERGHRHLEDLLAVPDETRWERADRIATEGLLHAVMQSRLTRHCLDGQFRLPQLGPLRELDSTEFLWSSIPGMYGGFRLKWDDGAIVMDSVSRMYEGSEERHRVTPNEARIVKKGWGAPTFVIEPRSTS